MKILRCLISAAIAVIAASADGLACSKSPALQTSAVPLTTGTVVFQGTANGQQYLYLFDVPSRTQKNISLTWANISTPENAHFSPNGRYLVFTAVTTIDGQARTDAFIWQIGARAPVGLTTSLPNQRYEDVIFTPSGSAVLIKDAGNIVKFKMDTSVPAVPKLTTKSMLTDIPESSGPYPTADGAGLYFWENTGESAYVEYLPYGGVPTPVSAPNTSMTYFPVTRSDGAVFLAAHDGQTDSSNKLVDQIYMAPRTGAPFASLSLNSCTSDNSDPAPAGKPYILFGNSRTGDYRAYLGKIANGKIWALGPSIGLGAGVGSVLGFSYTQRRVAPP